MIQTDTGLATLGTQDNICLYHVYPMLPGQCLFVSCVPNVARPVSVCIMCTQCCQARVYFYLVYGNIGYTRLNQILAWQHWVHKIKIDTGLATLGTHNTNRNWPGNRPVSGLILCTQCCQARFCMYLVFPKVARLVSVFILCTQCCQASVCLYLVYPMLPGPCLFLSCVPNVARPVSFFILWATLGTQD
jgi:hypothetical protein